MGHINRTKEIDQLRKKISELKSDLDNMLNEPKGAIHEIAILEMGDGSDISELSLVDLARRLTQEFEYRRNFFDRELFSDPAWLILLDLFIHNTLGKPVSVSSLYLAAKTPATTALRWINLLADRGMIERFDDPTDRRRVHLRLSASAYRSLVEYLSGIAGANGAPAGRQSSAPGMRVSLN